jgi:hypothetical protein
VLLECVLAGPRLEAKRLQMLHTSFEAVGVHACPSPGGTDKANWYLRSVILVV